MGSAPPRHNPYVSGDGGNVSRGSGPPSSNPYLDQDAPPSVSFKASANSHHRGFLGSVGHFLADKTERAAADVKSIPGGMYDIVNTEQHLLRKTIAHPLADPNGPNGVNSGKWGRHANKLVHGMEHGVVESVKHPLRDPFATALNVLPLYASVGKAADVATLGKLTAEPRNIHIGETDVPLKSSRNAATRIAQAAHDKVVQHALDTKPEGRIAKYAEKRVGGSIHETARYQARMRAVPAQQLAHAAKRLTGRLRGGDRVKQAALELTSVNTAPEDAVHFHMSQAEKGVSPGLNRAAAKLYQEVLNRGLLTKNEHGDVVVDAERHPDLAVADAHLADVQGKGDEILRRYGVRTPEQLEERVNAPGRIRAGASYEKPTPGKLGKSPAVDRAQRRVGSLQRRFDKMAEKAAGGYEETSRPRTEEEAAKRLAVLEERHSGMEKAIYDRMFPEKLTPEELEEQRFRNGQNGRAKRQESGKTRNGRASGASAWKSTRRQLVREDRWDAVEAEIQKALARMGDHPSAKRFLAERDEIHRLREALETSPEEAFGERLPRTEEQLGTVREARYKGPAKPRLERLGGALSIAKDELESLEKAAAKRERPTGIVGGNGARPGRGFVSYATSEAKGGTSAFASTPGPVIGEAKVPITSKAMTGEGIKQGLVPNDITGQAARHYARLVRWVNTSELRNAIVKTGSQVRLSNRQVLMRMPGETAAKIPDSIEEVLGRKHLTVDDEAGIQEALQAFKQDLLPGLKDNFTGDKRFGLGTSAEDAARELGLPAPDGYRWVSKDVVGDMAKGPRGPKGRTARIADWINSAVTAATVYFKFGHIPTRAFTNASTNIIQGSANPVQMAKSVVLWRSLSHEDKLRALAASGQHGYEAMPHEGMSKASRVAGAGANFYARRFDAPFRFNSITYEARRAGFDTPDKFHQMLDILEQPDGHDPKLVARADGVAKAANHENIAYDRLSEDERRTIARAVWFYPWLKGTVGFAANTALEHPFKAGVLAAAGERGREKQLAELGNVPSYEAGLFKLGGSAANPTVADFSTFSPFATPADVADALARPNELSDQLNPAYAALAHLIFGLDQNGNSTNHPYSAALAELLSPTPESQVVTAFRNRHKPQRGMFDHSPGQAFYRTLVGPGLPRKLNRAAANEAAGRETSGR